MAYFLFDITTIYLSFCVIVTSLIVFLYLLSNYGYKFVSVSIDFKDHSYLGLIISCFFSIICLYFHLSPLNTNSVYFFFPVVFSTHYKQSVFSLIYFMPKRTLQTFSSYRASIKNTTANANKSTVVLNQPDLKTVVEIQQNELNNLRSEKPQFIAKIANLESKIAELESINAELLKSNKNLINSSKTQISTTDFIPEGINLDKLKKAQSIIMNLHKIKSFDLSTVYLNLISLCYQAKINFQINWLNKKQFTFSELLLTLLIRPEILGELAQEFITILRSDLTQGTSSYLEIFTLLHSKNPSTWLHFIGVALHDKTIIFQKDIVTTKNKSSEKNSKFVKSYPRIFYNELNKFAKFMSDLACFIALPPDFKSETGLLSDKNLILFEPILDAISTNFVSKTKKDKVNDVISSSIVSTNDVVSDSKSSITIVDTLLETSFNKEISLPIDSSSNQEVSTSHMPVDSSEEKDDTTISK